MDRSGVGKDTVLSPSLSAKRVPNDDRDNLLSAGDWPSEAGSRSDAQGGPLLGMVYSIGAARALPTSSFNVNNGKPLPFVTPDPVDMAVKL